MGCSILSIYSRRTYLMVEENNIQDQSPEEKVAPIELPKDLQIPVQDVRSESILSIKTTDSALSKKIPWLWIIISFFAVLLIGGTIYFFVGRTSFNTGTILFTFEPEGVDVIIDGKFGKKSISSLTMQLKAGAHNIQIVREGYLDLERDFDIQSGEDLEMNVILEPIPDVELLFDAQTVFAGLVNNGQTIAFMNMEGKFVEVGSVSDFYETVFLFEDSFSNINNITWSIGEPSAIVKISGMPQLNKMEDNRNVRGRYIPLGERPTQGLPRNNGISTWLFKDAQREAEGWRPTLLNESIRSVSFAPDGSRIIYFYETSDGEKSLVISHPDGNEWERVLTHVDATNPQLQWLNDDRSVLLLDDNKQDRLFDVINKEFIEIMPERIANTLVSGSPDGTKILYFINDAGERKLALWDIASNVREQVFEESVTAFVWQTDKRIIVSKTDNTLWYWDLDGKQRPVQFVSSVGEIVPQKLFYSILSGKLFIIENSRVLSFYT